ncbi:chromate resistance protein ChrB domain-containing protein [Rhodoferax sp.]|uniref:chromate resistance protein ChrB domain-containing protein n=1 Tax=Rhodoferax sp. TaxID=50421 RepID=UPI002778F712|nr:chromate resistance protein [Rhodoferax sp.]
MDTTKPSSFSVSPSVLSRALEGPWPPLLIDVRKSHAFAESAWTLPGALRRYPLEVAQWARTLPHGPAVVVYCIHGHEVSVNTMQALRDQGIAATFLEGGIEAWREQGLPVVAKPLAAFTRWVTRARPRVDRIACPWLIRRFVDAQAQFLYVPTDQVATIAQREQATAYDVADNVAPTRFTHVGELCSFDAFIRAYRLGGDAALERLAQIVRGADTDRLDLTPQSGGLVALSLGMSRVEPDDHRMLEAMMPLYDALYAWCQDAVRGQDEKHTWSAAPASLEVQA